MISFEVDENERREDLMRAFLRTLLFKNVNDIDIDIVVDINMSNVNVCMLDRLHAIASHTHHSYHYLSHSIDH